MSFDYISGNKVDHSEAQQAIVNICDKVEWGFMDKRLSFRRYCERPDLSLFVKDSEEGGFIGYAVMKPWQGKTGKPDRYYLSFIALDPKFQGMGIGKELLNKIIDVAKEHGAVKIKTEHDDDVKLNQFYERATPYVFKSKCIGFNGRGKAENRLTYDLQKTKE